MPLVYFWLIAYNDVILTLVEKLEMKHELDWKVQV
jgi:hypothetical protein